jgi:hypothetical protein
MIIEKTLELLINIKKKIDIDLFVLVFERAER